MPIVKLDQLLKGGSGSRLESLVERSQNMGNLTQILRSELPADVAPYLQAANLRDDGELVLICRSPAWAARLRFESDCLLKAVRKAGLKAGACRVKVERQ